MPPINCTATVTFTADTPQAAQAALDSWTLSDGCILTAFMSVPLDVPAALAPPEPDPPAAA